MIDQRCLNCSFRTPELFAEYAQLHFVLVQARWADLLRVHQRFPELERIKDMPPIWQVST